MKIIPFERYSGQPLADDYSHHFAKVDEFYEYNPWLEESWARRAEALKQSGSLQVNRTELVHSLIRYNDKMNNAPEAFQALELLKNEETLVVVGGQQAGLFTGPLLVIYKAITIIRGAKQASERLGRPVVPVFWIAGEDHDFEEVNHAYVQVQNDAVKVKLPVQEGAPRTSISRLAVDQWEDVFQQLDELLMNTEFKAPIIDELTTFAGQSKTLSDFFARIMASIFGRHGLILLDSDDPGIRKLEGPMFEQLLDKNELINKAVVAAADSLIVAGYQPQVETSSQAANLFVFADDGERRLLMRTDSGYTDKKGQLNYSAPELRELAGRDPARLSNNVVTRPLMQQYLLPVLASVLGPGEIAYWGMLRNAFKAADMEMPILLPRKGFTLIEGTVQKNLDRYGLTLQEAFEQWEEKKQDWLRAQDELGLEEKFAWVKRQFADIYEPVLQAVATINPGMEKLGRTNAGKIIEQIEFLQARSIEANQSQYEASLRQWDRIRNTLFPLGKPQERVYNLYSYVNKYGYGWLDDLISEPLSERSLHSVVYL